MTDAELIARLRSNIFGTGTTMQAADRIEALIAERDEAINQQDSARHSVSVLEKRVKTFCDGWGIADKGRIEAEAKLAKAVKALEYYAVEAMPGDADDSLQARATLAEIKGAIHE